MLGGLDICCVLGAFRVDALISVESSSKRSAKWGLRVVVEEICDVSYMQVDESWMLSSKYLNELSNTCMNISTGLLDQWGMRPNFSSTVAGIGAYLDHALLV